MPPESTPVDAPGTLAAQQDALAAYIRDPERVPPPPGIEPRRLKIYRELFFNNVEGLLAGNFPVIRQTLGDTRWQALIRDFFVEHGCRTPMFTELARELMRYLDTRAAEGRGDPPWLTELAHYEWVELALQISDASDADIPHDPDGDLLTGRPLLSPLAWPLAYHWPVHRLGPDHQPASLDDLVRDGVPSPTMLMLRRDADGSVSFHRPSPLAFRLLQRLDEAPHCDGRTHLRALAAEAGVSDDDLDTFLADGGALLAQYRREGTICGTRLD